MTGFAMSTDLMTIQEAARFIGAHTNTLRRWSDRGLLKAYRIGPRADRRFRRDDVVRFLIQQYGRSDPLITDCKKGRQNQTSRSNRLTIQEAV